MTLLGFGDARHADGRVWLWLAFSLPFCAHFGLLATSLPISALWSAVPILHVDHAFHFHQVWIAAVLGQSHAMVGWDPTIGAGMVVGLPTNLSAKVAGHLAFALGSPKWAAQIYKVVLFVGILSGPVCVMLAAWLLLRDACVVLVSGLLAVLLWWVSDLRVYQSNGMVMFATGVGLAVVLAACSARLVLRAPALGPILLLGFALGWSAWVHALTPIAVAWACLALIVAMPRAINLRTLGWLAATVALTIPLLNLHWVLPTITDAPFMPDSSGRAIQAEVGWALLVAKYSSLQHGALLEWLLLLLAGIAALAPATRHFNAEGQKWARWMLGAAVLLMLYGSFGAAIGPLAVLQPNRFVGVASAFLLIPSGIGLALLLSTVTSWLLRQRASPTNAKSQSLSGREPEGGGVSGLNAAAAAIALLLATPILAKYAIDALDEALPGDRPRYGAPWPMIDGPGPVTAGLTNLILTKTPTNARLLFEGSTQGAFDRSHIAGYLVVQTGREILTSIYPGRGPVGFVNGWMFGRMTGEYSDAELGQALSAYGVSHVVASSRLTIERLRLLPNLRQVGQIGPVVVFDTQVTFDPFIQGGGRVVLREPGRLVLDGLSGDEVVLRYHWHPRLLSDPPAVLRPVTVDGAKMPFIGIESPAARVELRLDR